jgi:hypothetical protein
MSAAAKRTCSMWIVLLLSSTIGGCSNSESKVTSATLNQSAALAGNLPANPLAWKVVTSSVDKPNSTMSTLYGNDIAVGYARGNSGQEYPEGSKLALVTWSQQEDDRWFGAKIPAEVKSVEFVFVQGTDAGQSAYSYERYEGAPLTKIPEQSSSATGERVAYLLSQRAAVMP